MEPPDGAGYRRAYRDDAHEFEFDDRTRTPPPIAVPRPLPRAPQQIPGAPFECLVAAAAANAETTGARVLCVRRGERIWDLGRTRPCLAVPIGSRGRRGIN